MEGFGASQKRRRHATGFYNEQDVASIEDAQEVDGPGEASGPNIPTAQFCIACGVEKDSRFFSQQNITSECDHDNEVCLDCLQVWLKDQLNTKGWRLLNCPQCESILQRAEVVISADKETIERYEHLSGHAVLDHQDLSRMYEDDSDYEDNLSEDHFDSSPTRSSQRVRDQAATGGDEPEAPQEQLEAASNDERASDAVINDPKLDATLKLIERITRACPTCGLRQGKDAGCDHVTCMQCGDEWCFHYERDWLGSEHVQCHRKQD